MKHKNASSGVQTIGSPRTLKLVFITNPYPVFFLNACINCQYLGFVVFETLCILAE